MTLQFDLDNVQTTEFGLGLDDNAPHQVPVDGNVQAALGEMVNVTWEAMQSNTAKPQKYEPSEKYASREIVKEVAEGNF